MKKVAKVIGVGLVGVAVVGAIAYAAKKLNEVDSFDFDFDNEDDDSDDDFVDEDIMSEEDFDDNFPTSNISNEEFIERTGLSREDCIQAIYDADEAYTKEELESMNDNDLIDLYDTISNSKESDESSSLDPFQLINEATRDEVIKILLDGNKDNEAFEYTEESLHALSDGELTQVYADYKVSIK